jgi:hypothetical protein
MSELVKLIQVVIVVNLLYNNWDKSVAKKIDKKIKMIRYKTIT